MMKNAIRYILRHPISTALMIIGIILSFKTASFIPLMLISVAFGAVMFFIEWLLRGMDESANRIVEHMKKYK